MGNTYDDFFVIVFTQGSQLSTKEEYASILHSLRASSLCNIYEMRPEYCKNSCSFKISFHIYCREYVIHGFKIHVEI